MRLFKATYKDRRGRIRESSKWYVEFKDHLGIIRRLPAFTDRTASEAFGRKVERLVACVTVSEIPDSELRKWVAGLSDGYKAKLERIGLLDPKQRQSVKALAEHVADFRATLEAKENTAHRVDLTIKRVQKILDACGFRHFPDIQASAVQVYLNGLRQDRKAKQPDGTEKTKRGIGPATYNGYLQAFNQFCRFMVSDRRAPDNPISHLSPLNARTDKRHERRDFTPEELKALLAAAESGRVSHGVPGTERALLYRFTAETGLRVSEIHSLTRGSFHLAGDRPTVTVAACYSKRRRDDTLPLRADTAVLLKAHMDDKLPTAPAFRLPSKYNMADMLRVDLERAGIPFRDTAGRWLDFHSLRHTFTSNLARAGVHPKVAQDLARHSDINLTLSRYTHTALEQRGEAVEKLPDLGTGSESAALAATGTDGLKGAERNSEPPKTVLADCLASKDGQPKTNLDGFGQSPTDSKGLTRVKWSHLWDSNPGPVLYEFG